MQGGTVPTNDHPTGRLMAQVDGIASATSNGVSGNFHRSAGSEGADGGRVPRCSSMRRKDASSFSDPSLDSALPLYTYNAASATKVNSCRNSDCQFSNVDCANWATKSPSCGSCPCASCSSVNTCHSAIKCATQVTKNRITNPRPSPNARHTDRPGVRSLRILRSIENIKNSSDATAIAITTTIIHAPLLIDHLTHTEDVWAPRPAVSWLPPTVAASERSALPLPVRGAGCRS